MLRGNDFTHALTKIGGRIATDDRVVRYRGRSVGRVFPEVSGEKCFGWAVWSASAIHDLVATTEEALAAIKVELLSRPEHQRYYWPRGEGVE